MPTNPFLQGDPLAPSGGQGLNPQLAGVGAQVALGAAATAHANGLTPYEVVEIPGDDAGIVSKAANDRVASEAKQRSWFNFQQQPKAPAPEAPPPPPPNYPSSCLPIVYHKIADLPEQNRGLARRAHIVYAFFCTILILNAASVLVAVTLGKVARGSIVGLACAAGFLVVGIPASWMLWYFRLYNALRADGWYNWGMFFLFVWPHMGFCIYCGIAPSIFVKWAYAGLFTALDLLKGNQIDTILSFIFFGLAGCWALQTVMAFGLVTNAFLLVRSRPPGQQGNGA